MTPTTLLHRLEGLLVAKSEEIQLAGRLGESLLHQQAELEAKIAELESVAAAATAGQRSRAALGLPSNRRGVNGDAADTSEDDAAAHLDVGDEVKRKLEALEQEMAKWDEGNEFLYRNVGTKGPLGSARSQSNLRDVSS